MSSKNVRISIITLGCPKNQVDSEKLAARLAEKGFIVEHESSEADVFIVNTCGFIRPAQEESIEMLLTLRAQHPKARIVAMGCMTQLFKEELQAELREVDDIYGVNEEDRLIHDLTGEALFTSGENIQRNLSTPSHYAYLKISEGCNRSCSFCTIPKIRGKLRSVPIDVLFQEAKLLASKGVKELILVSQDTVSYGMDLEGKPQLVNLLKVLSEIEGLNWLRVMYLYPSGVTDDLIREIVQNEKVVKYFDIPFQHSHDKVLKTMERNTTTKQLEILFEKIRSWLPMATIRGTVIVGFPEESNAEFEHLMRFVEQYKFEKLAIFPFSLEEKAPVFQMKNVFHFPHAKTVQKRYNTLSEMYEKLSFKANEKYVGTSQNIILDYFDAEENAWIARTEYDAPEIDFDVKVFLKNNSPIKQGEIKKVKIVNLDLYRFNAEL